MTSIDPWFLEQMKEVVEFEAELEARESLGCAVQARPCARAKRYGISDAQLAKTWGADEICRPRARAKSWACAPSSTAWIPARPSSRASRRTSIPTTKARCEADPTDRKKVMILGSGPNRIGQGIEFDYCCCHASFALQEMGVESIMVNCNPETVSTDYDTSDRLYFEPLTLENVLNICRHREARRRDRAVRRADAAQPGAAAEAAGVPIIGTDPDDIDLAEDRKLFGKLLDDLAIPCARQRHGHQRGRGLRKSRGASAIRCWCGPATCWAAAPW